MELGLKGKAVILSGGSMGIGFACAQAFAREGARVAIAARNEERLNRAAERIRDDSGAEIVPVSADMTNQEDVRRFVQTAHDRFGRIDVLVNNAGAAPGGLIDDIPDEGWFEGINLKFLGYMRMIRETAAIMTQRGGGRIVNVIGNDGNKPYYGEVVPGAANAAGHNLTVALAEQYGRHNILINAVNPGPVETERWDTLEKRMAQDKGMTQEQVHALTLRSLPLGRICTPEEVAPLVQHLDDVGMLQSSDERCFALEPLDDPRVVRVVRVELLDGDRRVRPDFTPVEHAREAAGREQLVDLVGLATRP